MLQRLRRSVFAGVSVAMLGGCDDQSGPDLSGSWSGTIAGTMCATILTLAITESDRGIITGTGNLASPPSCGFVGSIAYSVSGEHDHPSVTLTLQPAPGSGATVPTTITGTVEGADTINATFEGSSITLERQQTP